MQERFVEIPLCLLATVQNLILSDELLAILILVIGTFYIFKKDY